MAKIQTKLRAMSRKFPEMEYRRVWWIREYVGQDVQRYIMWFTYPTGDIKIYGAGNWQEILDIAMDLTRCQYGDRA